jgi:hypothetical protein
MIKKFQGYVPKGEAVEDTFEEGRNFWRTKTFGMFKFKGKRFIKRTITIEVKDEEV